MRAARAATVLCMALSTCIGTWYLRMRIPEREWLTSYATVKHALDLGRYSEAERLSLAAVEAARAFGEGDPRMAHSLFLRAQALVGQSRQSEALPLLERCMAIYAKSLGRDRPEFARVLEYYEILAAQKRT